jgi:hypothetical protein
MPCDGMPQQRRTVDPDQCPALRAMRGWRHHNRGEHDMHPILREILMEPVGWLAIGGSIIMVGISVFVALFVRRKVREEEKKRQR